MFIDKTTLKALNIELIVEKIQPVSELGLQAKNQCLPFCCGAESQVNLAYKTLNSMITKLKKQPHAAGFLKETLPHIHNINFILQKIQEKAVLELYELQEVKQFLFFYLQLSEQSTSLDLNSFTYDKELAQLFSLLDAGKQNTPSFFLHDSYSEEFAQTRQEMEAIQNKIEVEFNALRAKAAVILERKSLSSEIVVSRLQQEIAEQLFQNDSFYLKSENFANYCFALRKSDYIVEREQKLNVLQDKLMLLEAEIRAELTQQIAAFLFSLQESQKEAGTFDWLLAKAEFAIANRCTIPEISSEKTIFLQQARNLPVEWELQKNQVAYQPISIHIENQLNVLTGANMAGKTTLLKMLGQLQYLTAFAIPLPCQKARLPLVDFIFFSGLYEERMDLSSFGTEIVMLQEKWKQKGFGFFLIDEFARGTNPHEGEAFSQAVLDEFSQKQYFTMFSTHFQAPITVKHAAHFQIAGFTEADIAALKKEKHKDLTKRLQYLHQFMNYDVLKVDSQTEPPRAALLIAELLGVEERIIQKAYRYLKHRIK